MTLDATTAPKPDENGGSLTEGQLSGKELAALAERMINASTKAEKDALREEIVRGFYGNAGPRL
ncbi:MAG TPA: hypothetical protein VNV15_06405 [Opitutaceae bacterium]|jgi:hypothetical protein|nr:hypothetical protein [Opitutaceae bacterium]